MKIQRISSQTFHAQKEKNEKKQTFIDKFSTGIKNSADMNDTVTVPRTIFKGYMAFTLATSLGLIASSVKKHPRLSTSLATISTLSGLWGTYSFVRPYLISDGTQNTKAATNEKLN